MQQETEEARHVEGAAPPSSHHRQHSDLADPEHDSYSDPIDLINAQENANKHRPPSAEYVHSKQNSDASRDSYLYTDDSYSNPIDMMNDPNHNVSPPRTRGHHASAGHKSPRLAKLFHLNSINNLPTSFQIFRSWFSFNRVLDWKI